MAKGNSTRSLQNVINVRQIALKDLDTDATFTDASDAKVPSQLAVKTYVDGLISGTVHRAESAEKISEFFPCDATAALGDLVIISRTTPGKVEVISNNVYNGLVLGVIIGKPAITTAEVLISGKLGSGLISGLDYNMPVFVGLDGKPTVTPPTTGHLQALGTAITPTVMFLLVSVTKTIRA